RFSRDWSSDVCSSDLRQVQRFRVDGNAQHTSRQRIVARPRVFAIVVLYLTMVSACAAVDEDVLLVRADYRAIETVVENRLGAAEIGRACVGTECRCRW